MLVYSPHSSNRLAYILSLIGNELEGEPWITTSDADHFKKAPGAKINYSDTPLAQQELWIKPHPLLNEVGIHKIAMDITESNGQIFFFKTGGGYPFDVFAAVFYLVSRYEEYLPHTKDMYGRYAHQNALAFQHNFLQQPMVNIWLEDLKRYLMKHAGASFHFHKRFTFLPTYDIDEAFSYKHKGLARTAAGFIKAVLGRGLGEVGKRAKVLISNGPDPFYAFPWMDALHEKYKLQPRYFFLMAHKLDQYDRNILPHKKALRELVGAHARYDLGIHPSWQSGDNPQLLFEEIKTLEEIIGRPVISSRQHFIRFQIPDTFRRLIDAGIKEDFSMGYATINGFRASIASPFKWYDLEREGQTELTLYPFCHMDANSFFELKHTPKQALQEMEHYHRVVKSVNGTLCTLWHNTFLGTDTLFAGWRDVYETFVEQVAKDSTTTYAQHQPSSQID